MVNQTLLNKLNEQYDKDDIDKIISGYNAKRLMSFRINNLKANPQDIIDTLTKEGYILQNVSWYPLAYIVLNKTEEDMKKLTIYQDGLIYLQSLSSMLPVIALNPNPGDHILDMTAAPGSKTTQIAAMTHNKARLTACERNHIRFERLKYNLSHQGVTSCTAMQIDATNLDDLFSFDKILLDAPCSGSGTISINNQKMEMFTSNTLNKITNLQYNLLKKALTILKPGQTMVYSTCSILKEENEDIIEKVSKQFDIELLPIQIDGINNILPTKIPNTICLYPNEYFEGFFIALIKKSNNL